MDLFRECLIVIKKIFAEQRLHDWEKRIDKDLQRWDNRKAVVPFLAHFGGVGSINDLVLGDGTFRGIWVHEVFDLVSAVAWDYAISIEQRRPQNIAFILEGRTLLDHQQCWECVGCGNRVVTGRLLEKALAKKHLPLIFAAGLQSKNLSFLLDIDTMMERVESERAAFVQNCNQSNIQFELDQELAFKKCSMCNASLVRSPLGFKS